ncbi:winged helix-turn-helix transcriptional regulator [Agrococcus jejuensis]|uniref:winged helix-turn-helix transcriptional regulator n=1 Tax=Agrococcus jejuensis TaxID=399736 RepID=UPI0021B60968|nr:helix-turn-helix domain-containing protein [Agrococcus jejuensis]
MHETTTEPTTITGAHRELLDQLLDRWSLEVLDRLCEHGALRFNGLRRSIPAITQKSLTATLRRLERNGMVERVVLSDRPVAVEYRIAPVGQGLQDLIDALLQWSTRHMADVEAARERYDEAEAARE